MSSKSSFRAFGLAALIVALPTHASAFCYQGSDINGALDYLICLHNEQNRTINDLGDTVSNNARIFNDNSQSVGSKIDDLEQEVESLRLEIDRLRSELHSLRP